MSSSISTFRGSKLSYLVTIRTGLSPPEGDKTLLFGTEIKHLLNTKSAEGHV